MAICNLVKKDIAAQLCLARSNDMVQSVRIGAEIDEVLETSSVNSFLQTGEIYLEGRHSASASESMPEHGAV